MADGQEKKDFQGLQVIPSLGDAGPLGDVVRIVAGAYSERAHHGRIR